MRYRRPRLQPLQRISQSGNVTTWVRNWVFINRYQFRGTLYDPRKHLQLRK